ncbi:MAG: TIGR01906 family membrane protein [Candidatus Enterenecus sp.]
MRQSKPLTALLAVLTAVALLTGAIAVPILCRPFYYAHIESLDLCRQTGLTEEQIRTAYDEMLDYCLGAEEFSTGVLRWSESGKSHFTDVRGLFLLDLKALAISASLLIVVLIAARLGRIQPGRLLGRGPAFWAGAGLGGAFLLVGGLAALDFDRAFIIFHALFFPGKDNWLFDPRMDEIITILPQEFFMDCALLILAILIIGCAALILYDLLRHRART